MVDIINLFFMCASRSIQKHRQHVWQILWQPNSKSPYSQRQCLQCAKGKQHCGGSLFKISGCNGSEHFPCLSRLLLHYFRVLFFPLRDGTLLHYVFYSSVPISLNFINIVFVQPIIMVNILIISMKIITLISPKAISGLNIYDIC